MRRKTVVKLEIFRILSLLLISIFILIALSFLLNYINVQWWSNMLLNVGCGLLTGVVLYFLTNIRNSEYNLLKAQYAELDDINWKFDILYWDYYLYENVGTFEGEADTFCERLIETLRKIIESLLHCKESIYYSIDFSANAEWNDLEQWIDNLENNYYEFMEDKYSELTENEIIEGGKLFYDSIRPQIREMLKEKRNSISIYHKFPL